MKKSVWMLWVAAVWAVISVSPLLGQGIICPVLVQQALQAAETACQETGRNQLCYGNVLINATAADASGEITFQQVGDIVDVTEIQSLALSGMDTQAGNWGVAIMKLQTNVPGALPGQLVMFVLFGNVEIENAAEPLPTVNLTASAPVAVLDMPDGNIVANAAAGETFAADGQSPDGAWLRVLLPSGERGWVAADAAMPSGDLTTLIMAEPGDPVFGPMQAFYFRTGIGDAPCAEAPDSGLMIQTPEGIGRMTVNVNGVNMQLGSTAYMRSITENEFGISLVEGSAIAEVDGFIQYIPAGAWITVPTDDEGTANGAPNPPQPYNNERMFTLPTLLLDREVEVPPSLTQDEIAAALEDFIQGTDDDDDDPAGSENQGGSENPSQDTGGSNDGDDQDDDNQDDSDDN